MQQLVHLYRLTKENDVTELTKDAVLAEIDATQRELTDIMNVDSPLRDRVRREQGMDGIQRAVHKVIALRRRLADLPAEHAGLRERIESLCEQYEAYPDVMGAPLSEDLQQVNEDLREMLAAHPAELAPQPVVDREALVQALHAELVLQGVDEFHDLAPLGRHLADAVLALRGE